MPELVCYRASAYRTPLRVRRHRADDGGRYHDPGAPATQYFALHPLGPWAEVIRRRRLDAVEDLLELRLPVWAARAVLDEEPLRVDFEAAASGRTPVPIEPGALVDDDHSRCRAFAAALRADPAAPRALLVPSAALPGAENLVLLGSRRMIDYARQPRRPTQVPAAPCAVDARAARALLGLVRRRGERHAAHRAWQRGQAFSMPELDTTEL
jgi:hypothetical protein